MNFSTSQNRGKNYKTNKVEWTSTLHFISSLFAHFWRDGWKINFFCSKFMIGFFFLMENFVLEFCCMKWKGPQSVKIKANDEWEESWISGWWLSWILWVIGKIILRRTFAFKAGLNISPSRELCVKIFEALRCHCVN